MRRSARGLRVDNAFGPDRSPICLTIGADGRIGEPDEPVERVVDASGLTLEPGFVDLQVNGAFGHHCTTDPARIWDVGAGLVAHGLTSFLPTLISASVDEARAADEVLVSGPPEDWIGSEPLGLHLEGPALAPEFRGAHGADSLVDPSRAVVGEWLKLESLRLVTLAPELPGAMEAIGRLVEAGVAVSLGHTGATGDQVRAAVDAGASMVTHLFNAMAPFHHRDPGVIGAVLDEDRLAVGLIADDVHVESDALALVWRSVGADRIVLTGDVVAGLGSGIEVARAADGTLVGGTTPFHEVRANMMVAARVDGAIPSATSTTACRVLGETGRGRVRSGDRGDVVLLNTQGTPLVTIVGGVVAHDPEGRCRRRPLH